MKNRSRQNTLDRANSQERRLASFERHEMDKDPLTRLDRTRTKRLEEFMILSAEDNDSFFNHETLEDQDNDYKFHA